MNCSEAFGSKISSENIPGTPMEPVDYGAPGMPEHSGALYNDQMALISDGRRPSLKGATVPSSPQRENNLNSVMNNRDRSGELVKFNLNHNHDPNNSTALVLTGPNTKRSSLAMSVLEIVENRKNSKQDQEVIVLLFLNFLINCFNKS